MSNTTSGPSLDDYPGYFPASKPPFWTRRKVGVGAALLGIFLGAAAAPGAADPADPPRDASATQTSPEPIQGDEFDAAVAQAVDQATGPLQDKVWGQRAKLQAQREKLAAQKRAAALTLKRVKREAAAAQRRAVTAAVNRTRAEARAQAAAAAAVAQPQPLASPGGSTDPHFSWCYEANDAGYGPYYQGQDPEYDWYDDADGDGVVCET